MTARMRAMVAAGWALAGWSGLVAQEKGLPTIGYDVARGMRPSRIGGRFRWRG
jgi:hypothetical protein